MEPPGREPMGLLRERVPRPPRAPGLLGAAAVAARLQVAEVAAPTLGAAAVPALLGESTEWRRRWIAVRPA